MHTIFLFAEAEPPPSQTEVDSSGWHPAFSVAFKWCMFQGVGVGCCMVIKGGRGMAPTEVVDPPRPKLSLTSLWCPISSLRLASSGGCLALGSASAFVSLSNVPPRTLHREGVGTPRILCMRAMDRRPRISSAQQPQPHWVILVASWFKLPLPAASTTPEGQTSLRETFEDDRVIIQELRDTNARLRAELSVLRTEMEMRGVNVNELESEAPSLVPTIPSTSREETTQTPSKDVSQTPPDGGALLVGLWTAALVIGGIFIPLAIGETARGVERWSDSKRLFLDPPEDVGRFRLMSLSACRRRARRRWSDATLLRAATARTPSWPERAAPGLPYEDPLVGAYLEIHPIRKSPTWRN